MSCVCILTPVVIAAWPAFSAAVVAAATSLGYEVLAEQAGKLSQTQVVQQTGPEISLEIAQSELVTSQLGRGQEISVRRNGVTVTFSRDARGKAALCVSGTGQTEEALRALGQELSGRVVQKYVYQRLMDEMRARQFVVVEEETDASQSIRLKVRHWDH
jgi:hypothetical protein